MPVYNFECRECGKRFEELTAYDRRDQMRCPVCSGETRVLVSGFAVRGSAAPAPAASSRFS